MYNINLNATSYVSSKVEVRNSLINGKGSFAIESITKGETIFIKGGFIVKKNEVYTTSIINSYLPISDDYYIGATSLLDEESVKLYINHSCNPNCGMKGEITFVAIRNIEKGEEITIDYAFIDNEEYSFICNCGSENCRHVITGYDWKQTDIQSKYYNYFSQYLKNKIKDN